MRVADASFRALPRFNEPELRRLARSRYLVGDAAAVAFPGTDLRARFARALCEAQAINLKELLESFEFHDRVRRRIRRPRMADLACGHGLTGILFALLERTVEHVVLVDTAKPKSFERLVDVAESVGPHVRAKLRYLEEPLEEAELPADASLLAVHACGLRTDRCLDRAIEASRPIAAMPCCYRRTAREVPSAVKDALGAELATDVHRTYRLEKARYRVDWAAIPQAITPMNRILVAIPAP
jgi:hypothetical protein